MVQGASMFVLGMWFRSLSQLIMEFQKGLFLAFLCLLFILGYLKDSNAAAHSVDTGIS